MILLGHFFIGQNFWRETAQTLVKGSNAHVSNRLCIQLDANAVFASELRYTLGLGQTRACCNWF